MAKEAAKGNQPKAVSSDFSHDKKSHQASSAGDSGVGKSLFSLPKGIFAVSLFGLFLGMSTTMVYSQLSLFLANELHVTATKVAFIDGIVEFLSFLTRIFSGIFRIVILNGPYWPTEKKCSAALSRRCRSDRNKPFRSNWDMI